jgi:hypothetical protein
MLELTMASFRNHQRPAIDIHVLGELRRLAEGHGQTALALDNLELPPKREVFVVYAIANLC